MSGDVAEVNPTANQNKELEYLMEGINREPIKAKMRSMKVTLIEG